MAGVLGLVLLWISGLTTHVPCCFYTGSPIPYYTPIPGCFTPGGPCYSFHPLILVLDYLIWLLVAWVAVVAIELARRSKGDFSRET